MAEDNKQNEQIQQVGKTKKCPKCMMDVDIRAQKCGHCGAELNRGKKFITGCLGLIVLYFIFSIIFASNSTKTPAYVKPTPTSSTPSTDTQPISTGSTLGENTDNSQKTAAVIDVPDLFTKNLSQMKDELTLLCGQDAVTGFNYAESEKSKVVSCLISNKYNIYFELTSDGGISPDGVRLIGHSQYNDSEASVLAAAGVTKDLPGYNIVIKPANSMGDIILDVTKGAQIESSADSQENKEIRDYYTKLVGYQAVVAKTYYDTAKKAGDGDVAGAYLDFKGDAGYKISGARQQLFELSIDVPDVADKQLLKDAADKLSTGAYKIEEAMKLFEEGVENDSSGKILEATAASQKGAGYFNEGSVLLKEIATKYNLAN